ncbi:MAG TPA: acyltransferase family protein [Dyella sp.]|uniref:acyltransferase family protein n=1 Tax=Dyella sp. TaxID=1869338 RepID=UPI002F9330EB
MSASTRRHDIDALRVLAFGLLIFFHLGMLYVADWDFHLKSSHTAEWLQYPMMFLNRWRMELLFVISGLAVHFLRGKTALPRLAWKRTVRLMLPLLVGMAVIVPIQPYVQGLSNGLVQPGFGTFLLRYWTGGPWPAHAFDGWQFGVTWNHLWYLPYLWCYTMVLLIAMPLIESPVARRLRERLPALRGAALLLLPALPLFVAGQLADRYPMTHALIGDWYAHALYGTCFIYGYLLGTGTHAWDELARLRRVSLIIALASFAVFIGLDHFGDRWLGHAPTALDLAIGIPLVRAAQYLYMWTAIATVLGFGHTYLNRPFRWLPYAREAVYPWYILHQSVMLALAWQLLPLGLGPIGEPLALLVGTVAGCAIGHEIIRRVAWLRPLFGLERIGKIEPSMPRISRLADDLT